MEGKGTSTSNEQDEKGLDSSSFLRLSSSVKDKSVTPLIDLPRSYRSEIESGFSTGWQCVDDYIKGLRKGEVTVITADTGAGKTTFCTQLMVHVSMQGNPVWINSWEMKPEIVMRKIASLVLRKPMKIINFSAKDNEQFDEFCLHYKIYINQDIVTTNISMFEKKLNIAKKLGVRVVMIDHLDYLVSNHKEKTHEAIDEAVKKLHELAFSTEMHFLLICHPRQTVSGEEEIGIHSLKGSSSIKQYADNIIILHKMQRSSESQKGKVKIRIGKNRMFGSEGVAYLYYQESWDGYLEAANGSAHR